jgi:hypothetical protein
LPEIVLPARLLVQVHRPPMAQRSKQKQLQFELAPT